MTAPGCPLCAAERLTEWFHEDDDCWIADCTICATPMVVWKVHDPRPPDDVRARLHDRLAEVVASAFVEFEHYVDDRMRQIPDHYHAHARPVGGFFGHRLRRRP